MLPLGPILTQILGKLDYQKITGLADIRPGQEKPVQADTILMLASGTKLLTTIAVLQLVEQGALQLDENIEKYVPEFAKQQILTGFADDGTPQLKPRTKPITLRHLLTHSSGASYDFSSELIARYQKHINLDPMTVGTVDERFGIPLLFEPGEGWNYSPGLDRAGQIVEKISGLTLEEYMKKHMFPQLGITNITYWPQAPEIARRRWVLTIRDQETGKVAPFPDFDLNTGATECCGGQGAYGSMEDYIKVLHSLLVDDEKLLKKETTALMFRPHLDPDAKASLLKQWKDPSWAVGVWPDTGEYDHGLSGILVDGDSHEYRKRGTLLWSGSTNMPWVRSCHTVLLWRLCR